VIVLVLATTASVSSLTARAQSDIPTDDVTQESLRFTRVVGAVEQNYVDDVNPDQLILDGGIRGMLASLDPFSNFFDREQFKMLQQQARGEGLGFGTILYVTPGKILVLQTAQGSPSWRAGLGPGDEIVSVNGRRIASMDFQTLIQYLTESRSHPVRLGIIPPGMVVPKDVDLSPSSVALPTVDKAYKLADGTAYIHLTEFEGKTPQEVVDALDKVGGKNPPRILLDLRDNRGGIVDSAVAVASLFMKPGLPVLTTRGRAVPPKEARTLALPVRFDQPLIVLVNEGTASAAEVLVAALQEHDRALVVGQPTYGKGVVQSVIPLSEQTGLALTTAQYFTPSGRSIQKPLAGTAWSFAKPGAKNTGKDDSQAPEFHTDDGRPVRAAGGVTPDVLIPARSLDPWLTFLNDRGLITNFAASYMTVHSKPTKDFEPDDKIMQSFRDSLLNSHIRVPEEYWKNDQDYLKLRVRQEILTLAYGLDEGNKVDVLGDPQVQAAQKLFPKITAYLHPPAVKPSPPPAHKLASK
jgi:carboxyl-terminal processing protease